MHTQPADAGKKPKPTIEVRYNGEGKSFPYKPQEKVHKLLEAAISAFGIAENVHTLALYTSEGVELKDEQQKLEDAGVEAGDVLRLRTSKVKGGAGLDVGEGLLEQTLSTFAHCGQGRDECVVFWAGPVAQPGFVNTFLHPEHRAARGGYEVAERWLAAMWDSLDDKGLAIRLQAHTHPRAAFHSAIDDSFPIVATAGFYSLVLPRFGLPPQTLADAFLVRLNPNGKFIEVEITELEIGECTGMEVAA